MAKKELISEEYEHLITELNDARLSTCQYLIIICEVVNKAKLRLSQRQWIRWLKDKRINIKKNQAEKYISIANNLKNNIQLTGFLKKHGIEKTYELCRIQNEKTRIDLAEKIIDVQFTVKQTKNLVEKLSQDNIDIDQAINEIKIKPEKQIKTTEIKSVSLKQYLELQECLKNKEKEYQELLEKFNELNAKCSTSNRHKKTNINSDYTQLPLLMQDTS